MSDSHQPELEDEFAEIEELGARLIEKIYSIRKQLRGGAEPTDVAQDDEAQTQARKLPEDFISTGQAAQGVKLEKSTIRKLCAKHPIGQPGGFAMKIGGRWHISRELFRTHIGL